MNNVTECAHCHFNLHEVEEIHAAYGKLYCSKECAIEAIEQSIIRNAHESAIAYYEAGHELVSREILEGETDE